MILPLKVLIGAAITTGCYEGIQQSVEINERRQVFNQAREYADIVDKPLLVVGAPKSFWDNHPGGDITIDINPNVKSKYPYIIADVRDIPFPPSTFGAAYCSHVLEHLGTKADAEKALNEMYRVADKVFVVSPHKTSLSAWINREHNLWVLPTGDGYVIEQRGVDAGAGGAKRYVSAVGAMDLNELETKSGRMAVAMNNESIIGNLKHYHDLAADVRYANSHAPVRQLVTPNDPEVKELADMLYEDPDFIGACQQFVNSFTTYKHELGDYWATSAETLALRAGDCDCLAILLCSLLRNYIPAERVYCAVGVWQIGNTEDGHMFVVVDQDGEDLIIEATTGPNNTLRGHYNLYAIFNDKYAFSTEEGLVLFDMQPVKSQVVI